MNREERQYILQHREKESAARMAKVLGLKERKVRHFLERARGGVAASASRAGSFVFDRRSWGVLALIVLLGLVVYANSLSGPFIWDDHSLIEKNTFMGDWSRLGEVLTRDVGAGFRMASNFYRPLQIVSFMADHSLWGLNVFGWHLTNILWHILAAGALYVFVGICFDDKRLAMFTSILFLVHPVHTEAVSYISGRADPMALLFVLLAFIGYLKSDRGLRYSFLMGMSYAAALLSKESGLILLLLIPVYHATLRKAFRPRPFAALVLLSGLYLWLRSSVVDASAASAAYATTVGERLPGFFAAVASYMRLLIWPVGLHMEYGLKEFPFAHPMVFGGLCIVLFSFAVLGVRRRRPGLVGFSIALFFAALLPVANIYPINAYMAEHWLYVPSIGFFLLAAKGLMVLGPRDKARPVSLLCFWGLVAFFSVLTVRQNQVWGDPMRFYEYTLRHAPDSTRVLNNLAIIYHEEGRLGEAIACHEKAISLVSPSDPLHYTKVHVNHFNLGNIYRKLGRFPEAVASYKTAIEIGPKYLVSYVNLGGVYQEMGRFEEAQAIYRQAIGRDPGFMLAYDNLALLYVKSQRWEEALILCREALAADPAHMDSYNNLAIAYSGLGRVGEAIKALERAVEVDPHFVRGYQNLAKACFNKGEYSLAVRYYDRALELGLKGEPDFLRSLERFR